MAEKTNLIEYEDIGGDAWLEKGDAFRIWQYKPQEAIECYKYAISSLDLSTELKRYAKHMIGVCCTMLDDYSEAMVWFEEARKGSTKLEEANILRDMGNCSSKVGDFHRAEVWLAESIEALSFIKNPTEVGATIGFMARNATRQGLYEESLTDFSVADSLLMEHNPQLALYNRLHWASSLSHAGYVIKSFKMSVTCFSLARRYGSKAHLVRAVSLMLGGWRAERLMQKCKKRMM